MINGAARRASRDGISNNTTASICLNFIGIHWLRSGPCEVGSFTGATPYLLNMTLVKKEFPFSSLIRR